MRFEMNLEAMTRAFSAMVECYGTSSVELNINSRSRMILGYHPEWAAVTASDYRRVYPTVRALQAAIQRGDMAHAAELHEAMGEDRREALLRRVGVDTGQLYDDIASAGLNVRRGR